MEQSSNKKAGRSRKYTIIILLILFIIGTVQALSGRTGSVIAQVDDNMLGVVGSYGDPVFVRLDEITRLELVDAVNFGRCLEGEEKSNTMSGLYENGEFGTYTLHVYTSCSPYIVIGYGDGNTLIFNQKTAKLTRKIYEDLTAVQARL